MLRISFRGSKVKRTLASASWSRCFPLFSFKSMRSVLLYSGTKRLQVDHLLPLLCLYLFSVFLFIRFVLCPLMKSPKILHTLNLFYFFVVSMGYVSLPKYELDLGTM
jgi:hypothetical protein